MGFGFEKSELVSVAEKLYECKEEIRRTTLELENARFHDKHIPLRKKRTETAVTSRLLFIIPLTFIWLVCVGMAIYYIGSGTFEDAYSNGGYSAADGMILLASFLFIIFGGYTDYHLLKDEIRMVRMLWASKTEEEALQYASQKDIVTFQSDAIKSKMQIELLENKLHSLEEKFKELEVRQGELLAKKEEQEDVLRKHGILYDEKPEGEPSGQKFKLKEREVDEDRIRELHEYYLYEEQYINQHIKGLELDLQLLDRERYAVEENFELAKRRLIIFGVVFFFVVVFQSLFTGAAAALTSVLCSIGSIAAIFWLESTCKKPILLYLIEHENSLIQDYAFCNNMVPLAKKREELLQRIEEEKREVDEVREKRDALAFS